MCSNGGISHGIVIDFIPKCKAVYFQSAGRASDSRVTMQSQINVFKTIRSVQTELRRLREQPFLPQKSLLSALVHVLTFEPHANCSRFHAFTRSFSRFFVARIIRLHAPCLYKGRAHSNSRFGPLHSAMTTFFVIHLCIKSMSGKKK